MLFRDELEDVPCAKYERALDKLLTGYDAPLLYCMYLDKPMRDHLLQKRVGLVTDFVGVLRELKEALQFDRADVSGVIEDLDLLLKDFLDEIVKARAARLEAGEGSADEKLETVVGRLFDPEAGKAFYEAYRDIEALWEIPSPSRNCATISKAIRALCSGAQRLHAPQVGFVADLVYKTRCLVEEGTSQEGLGILTKTVTFDVKTVEAILAILFDNGSSDARA